MTRVFINLDKEGFDAILTDLVKQMSPEALLAIEGVYPILHKHLYQDVMDVHREREEEAGAALKESMENGMIGYTVNVADATGQVVGEAKAAGYHAYHAYTANGVTAIEIKARNRIKARSIASQFGKVLYIFE